jgi:hypothetical protein
MHVYLIFKELNYEGKPAKVETTNAITKKPLPEYVQIHLGRKTAIAWQIFQVCSSQTKEHVFTPNSGEAFWLFQTLLQGAQTC